MCDNIPRTKRGTTLWHQYFAPNTKVECDGYRSYLNLEGVELSAKKYETDDLHWLHKAISNLKTFLLGTYHGRCTKLQAYLDEYCFRFNRRMTGDQIFLRLTRAATTSCGVLSYADACLNRLLHNYSYHLEMNGKNMRDLTPLNK